MMHENFFTLWTDVCRMGMLRWSRCCAKQVQMLTSLDLMVAYPWLWLQR